MDTVKRLFRSTVITPKKEKTNSDESADFPSFFRNSDTESDATKTNKRLTEDEEREKGDVLPRHIPTEEMDGVGNHSVNYGKRRLPPPFRTQLFAVFGPITVMFTTWVLSIYVFLISFLHFLVNLPHNVLFYFTTFTKNPKFDTENFYSNVSTTTLTLNSAQITLFVTTTFNSWYMWSSNVRTTHGGRTREKTFYRDNTMNFLQYVTHILLFLVKCILYILVNFKKLVKKKLPTTPTATTTTTSTKTTFDQVYDVLVQFSAKLRIPIYDKYLFEPTYYIVVSIIFKKIVNLFLRFILFGVLHLCLKHHLFEVFEKNLEQNRSPTVTIILNLFWKVYDNFHFLVVSLVIIFCVFYFGGMTRELIWQKHVGDTIKTFWDNNNNNNNNNNEMESSSIQDSSFYDYESLINSITFIDEQQPVILQSSHNNQQFYPSFARSIVDIFGSNYSLSQVKSDVYVAVVQACFTTCINFEKNSHSSFVKIVDCYKTDNTINSLGYESRDSTTVINNFGGRGIYNIVSDIFFGFYNTYVRPFFRTTIPFDNEFTKRPSPSPNSHDNPGKRTGSNNRLFQTLIQTNIPYSEVGTNNNIQTENRDYVNLDILKCKNPVLLLNRKQPEQEKQSKRFTSTIFDDIVLWRRHMFKNTYCSSSSSKSNVVSHFADHSVSYHATVDNIFEWQLFTYSSGNVMTLFTKPRTSKILEECSTFDKELLQKTEQDLFLKEETEWLLVKSSELLYIFTLNMEGNMKCEKSITNIEEQVNLIMTNEKELVETTCTKHRLANNKNLLPFIQEQNSHDWRYYNKNDIGSPTEERIKKVGHQYFVQTSRLLLKSFYNFVISYMNTRKRLLSSVTGMGPDNGIYENLGLETTTTTENYFQFLPKVTSSGGLELSAVCAHIGYNNFKSGLLNFYTNTDAFNENSLWNPTFGINDAKSLLHIQRFHEHIETLPNSNSNPSQLNPENVMTLVEKTSKLGTKLGMRFFDKFKYSINSANSFYESYILSALSYSTSQSSEQTSDDSHNNNHAQSGGENNVMGFLPKQEFERSNLLRNLVVSRFKTLSKNITGENTRLNYPLFDLLISSPSQSSNSDIDKNREEINTGTTGKNSKRQFVLDNTGELYITSERFFDNLFHETENELNQLRNVVNTAVENFMTHSSSSKGGLLLDENITKYMEMLEDVLGYELKEDSKSLSKKLVWNMNMCSCSLHHFILSDHVVSAHYQSEVHPVQKEKSSYTTIAKSQVSNFTRGRVRSSDSPLFKSNLLQSIKVMTDKEEAKNDGVTSASPPTVLYNFQNNEPISLAGINVVDYPRLSTENFYNLKNVAKTISSDWKKILNLIVHLPGGPVQFPILYEAALADTYWTNWIDENVINPDSFYNTKCDVKSSYSKREQELYINLHKAMSVFGFAHTSLVETYDRVENNSDSGSKKNEAFKSSKYKKGTIKTSNYNEVMCLDYCNSLLGLLGNVAYMEFTQDYATLLQKDRSQTFDPTTDYPSYYCPKEKWSECNNMWKKTGN